MCQVVGGPFAESPLGVACRLKRTKIESMLAAALVKPCARSCASGCTGGGDSASGGRCAGCGRAPAAAKDEPPLQRCSRCLQALFCDEMCLKSAWPTHKKECGKKGGEKE